MKMHETRFVHDFETIHENRGRRVATETVGEFIRKSYRFVANDGSGDEYTLDTYSYSDGSLWYAHTWGANPCFIGRQYGNEEEFLKWKFPS